MSTTPDDDVAIPMEQWHRRLCLVAPGLMVSGDLDPAGDVAVRQLEEWEKAGITAVLDVRGEWTDEKFVARHAPQIRYWHLPTHDDGGTQDNAWFTAGVEAARVAAAEPDPILLVHCHMGINRAPSLALRIMLDRGCDIIESLDAIRRARPIAAIAYAEDAVAHFHRAENSPTAVAENDHERVIAWHQANDIDIRTVIRRIRQADVA